MKRLNIREIEMNNRSSERGNVTVIVLVVLAVVAVGVLAYLSGQVKPDADTDQQSAPVAESAPAAELSDEAIAAVDENGEAVLAEAGEELPIEPGNPVVAIVGEEEITRLDVLNFISQLPPQMRQMPIEQLFTVAQEQVINGRVLDQNMTTAGLEDDPEVLAQLEEAKEQIIRNAFMQREISKKMTEARLKKKYDEFVKSQPEVEEVNASHILVEDEDTAKQIIAQLKDGGDFAALAKEHSLDGTSENGGELGYFAKTDVVPEFAEAAFALRKGRFTETPIQSQFGYHVILQNDKRKRPNPTMEEAKQFLESELRREIVDEIIDDWRKDKEIKRFDINGNPA
ncbi:MAG: peptidylprolyl isomerase [Alphaproteobacteria bacterium]